MKKIILFLLPVFLCFVFICPISAVVIFDQGFDTIQPPWTGAGIYSDQEIAQTFTVGIAGFLSRIDLNMFKEGSPSILNVDLRLLNGDVPSLLPEDTLFSVSFLPSDVIGTSITDTFFLSVDVTAAFIAVDIGDQFAIVLTSPNSEYEDWYNWAGVYYQNPYPPGSGFVRFPETHGGEFHALSPEGDYSFRTFIETDPFCVSTSAELQAALTLATNNGQDDIIKIQQGTYNGNFVYSSSEEYDLAIEGGYTAGCVDRVVDPENTVLDAVGSGTVLVLNTSSVTANYYTNGLTIQNGQGVNGGGVYSYGTSSLVVTDCILTNNSSIYGGGIYLNNNSDVEIKDCTIDSNVAEERGGGIHLNSCNDIRISNCIICENSSIQQPGGGIASVSSSDITIEDATISNNTRGGIGLESNTSVTINKSTINSNTTDGGISSQSSNLIISGCDINNNDDNGGISIQGGTSIIENSTISGNSGFWYGAIQSMENYLNIDSCIISNNTAIGANDTCETASAIKLYSSNSLIINTIMYGNSLNNPGGAILCMYSSPSIVNSSIISNMANIYGGGIISSRGSHPIVTNSILWDNSPNEVFFNWEHGPSHITVSYSDVKNGEHGIITNSMGDIYWMFGNIDINPLFVDAANDDYRLTESSPCKDAGTNSAPELSSTDKDGNPRIMDNTVDMGAYEYPGNQEPPVAYNQDITTDEDTPVDITLEAYDKDLMWEFGEDKTGNLNNYSAYGDGENLPEPSPYSAESDYSAYFDESNNEYLSLDDISASVNMPWKAGTINKTGTVWLKFKTPSSSGTPVLFSKYNIGDDKRSFMVTYRTSDNKIQLNIGYNDGNSFSRHIHDAVLIPDTWYAVCASFEQNDGYSTDPEKVYIEIRTVPDGNIVGSNYSANAFDDPDNDEINIEDAPYMIGAAFNSANIWMPYEGNIDEVVIFNEKAVGSDFEQYAAGTYTGSPECLLDFEHTPLTFSIVSDPSNGTLSGTLPDVTYTPDNNFFGDDSFTFKVNDGYVDSNVATVDIEVEPVNDAPVITGQLPLYTESGVALEITLDDLTVTDVDNDYPADFTLYVQSGSNYTLDGNTITPDTEFTGVLVVPVYVNDGTDNSNTYNLNVTVDIYDACPDDPDKIAPGICGCGVPDTDTDGDGTLDCNDNCPNDPDKTSPGICGCGAPDIDSDQDGIYDCNDDCDSDLDTDGDGFGDCDENCPNDPNKTEPGVCGCGIADTDSDSDGTLDCNDNCPNDPNKINPGVCGCNSPDTDSDSDGTPDCIDVQPIASITSPDSDQTIEVGDSINFRCSVINGNLPYTYSWNFDGAAEDSTERTPEAVTFSEVGTFTVTLAVADNDGDIDSDTVNITVDDIQDTGDDDDDDGGGSGCLITVISE